MGPFLEWWNSLSQGVRDGIISTVYGGTVLAVAGALWKFSGKLALGFARLTQRVLNRTLPPAQKDEPQAESPKAQALSAQNPAPASLPQSSNTAAPALSPLIPSPPLVGFVARRDRDGRDILERLKEELSPGSSQLIALCGSGGVGKTTIAAEAVRALSDVFARRLAWVSADGRPDFTLSTLLDEVAAQLSHTEWRPLALEEKSEQVRALVAGQPTLVVLDNFETVAEPEQKRCAAWMARASCCAVITSRDEVEHARPINISAMSIPEAKKFVKLLIGQARHPESFKGLDRDEIIKQADRNPLLLQWVIRQIDKARQPRVVLRELARGEGDAAQRVFGRSFKLLDEDARAALLAISLFTPSAGREALAAVAGFGTDIERLDRAAAQLSDLWLIETTAGNERLTVEGLTRELAKSHLNDDERAPEFRQRFIEYFLDYAESHSEPASENYDALEAEKDNLLNAVDVASDAGDDQSVIEIAWTLALPNDGMLSVRGHWEEAIRTGTQGLKSARKSQVELPLAALAHNLAVIHQRRGELLEARRLYNESLEIKKRLDNQSGIAITLHQLAMLAQEQGEIDEARRLYNESLEIAKRLGDQSGIAITLHQLGRLAGQEGKNAEAIGLIREALSIFEKLKSPNAEVSRRNLEMLEGNATEES